MKAFLTIIASLFFFNQSYAVSNLGKSISFEQDPSNNQKLQFGATYMYGDDPDGPGYLLTFNPLLSLAEKQQVLAWNIYLGSENRYLMSWDAARSIKLAVVQVLMKDALVVKNILVNQKRSDEKDQVYFVLSDLNNFSPIYNFSISEICQKYPSNFADLTNSKKCNQITESDF